jgi:hypothetical protein
MGDACSMACASKREPGPNQFKNVDTLFLGWFWHRFDAKTIEQALLTCCTTLLRKLDCKAHQLQRLAAAVRTRCATCQFWPTLGRVVGTALRTESEQHGKQKEGLPRKHCGHFAMRLCRYGDVPGDRLSRHTNCLDDLLEYDQRFKYVAILAQACRLPLSSAFTSTFHGQHGFGLCFHQPDERVHNHEHDGRVVG